MAKSTHAFVVVIIGHFMHSLSLLIVLTRNRHCHKYVNISIDDFEMLIILTTLSLIHLCFTPVDTGLYPKWNQVLGLPTRHDVFEMGTSDKNVELLICEIVWHSFSKYVAVRFFQVQGLTYC